MKQKIKEAAVVAAKNGLGQIRAKANEEVMALYGNEHDHPWKTKYNAHLFPKWSEPKAGPGLTVPDLAMSLEEIIERSVRGITMEDPKIGLYDSDKEDVAFDELLSTYVPDGRTVDYAEAEQIAQEMQRRAIDAKRELARREKLRKEHELNELRKKLGKQPDVKAPATGDANKEEGVK